jgi:hypothetical protein
MDRKVFTDPASCRPDSDTRISAAYARRGVHGLGWRYRRKRSVARGQHLMADVHDRGTLE